MSYQTWFASLIESPDDDFEADVGSTVSVNAMIQAEGVESGEQGTFYVSIKKDEVVCDSEENIFLYNYSYSELVTCEFAMPNEQVTIRYQSGHACYPSGQPAYWKLDEEKLIHINPSTNLCDQYIKVLDEEGTAIDNATVKIYDNGTEVASSTTYYGLCSFVLDVGVSYRAKATKSGYTCLSCEQTFNACSNTNPDYPMVLTLERTPSICNQDFKAKDTDGNNIRGATIVARDSSGTWKGDCTTNSYGNCTISSLTQGDYLTACIEIFDTDEYEAIADSCDTFTVCTTSRETLKLRKKYVPGEPSWKSVETPYWVDDETVRIDCEGQNLVAGVDYSCEGFIETGCNFPLNSGGVMITSTSPIGYVQFKQLVRSYGCILPVDAIIKLYDESTQVYYDPVTRIIQAPGEESWKSVGNPYWDGVLIKVDCVAQNCEAGKDYHARLCCEGASPSDMIGSQKLLPDGAAERSCTVKVGKVAVENNCGYIPIAVDIILTESWTEKDRATRTVQTPGESHFSLSQTECWIGYNTHKCYPAQTLYDIPTNTPMKVHVVVTNTGTAADTPTFKVMDGTIERDSFTTTAPLEPGLPTTLDASNSFALSTNMDIRIEVCGSDGSYDDEVGC